MNTELPPFLKNPEMEKPTAAQIRELAEKRGMVQRDFRRFEAVRAAMLIPEFEKDPAMSERLAEAYFLIGEFAQAAATAKDPFAAEFYAKAAASDCSCPAGNQKKLLRTVFGLKQNALIDILECLGCNRFTLAIREQAEEAQNDSQ